MRSESTGLTSELVDYAMATKTDDIPFEVRDKAMQCVLDSVGCMIAGSRSRLGSVMASYARVTGADGPCTLFGFPEMAAAETACLVNSTLAHVLEMDDGHRPSDNHLGAAIVPAAIAVAQQQKSSGSEFLRSVVIGYDVMGRVGQAVLFPRDDTPFHHTATTAGLGAVVVAGLLMGLDRAQFVSAMGIAGNGGAGLREPQVSGADCKPFQVARGVQSGVSAAVAAACGLQGPTAILEGRFGFLRAFTPTPRREQVTKDLGSRFAVVESAFKVHAACGRVFTAVDAAIEVRGASGLRPDDIERVQVGLPRWISGDAVFSRSRPVDSGAARFSIPFCVAAALHDGEVTSRQLSDAGVTRRDLADVERKIEIVIDDEVDEIFERTKNDDFFFYPAAVTVEAGGHSYRRLVTSPRGYDPRRPLTQGEVIDKFVGSVSPVYDEVHARAIAARVLSIGSLDRIDGAVFAPAAQRDVRGDAPH
jgi:2-methylcitrate dehydratase PrpD